MALLGLGLDTLGKLGVWRRQPLSILQLRLPRCVLLTEITPPALFGKAAEGPFLGTHGACTAVGLFFLTQLGRGLTALALEAVEKNSGDVRLRA